jgi:membrane protein implicated in regulation of membrane protease activity
MLAVVSVWLAVFASAIPVLVGITPTTNTPKAVMAVLVDALLIYLFRPERRPRTQQEPVDEVEKSV